MNKNKFDFFLELGTSKIRGAAFKFNSDEKTIYHEEDNNILINSTINNFEKTNNLIKSFLLELEKKSGQYINSISLMIDATEMKSINLSVSKNMDEKEINKKDIIFLIRDAKQQLLQNQPDIIISHIVIVKFIVDKKVYDSHPIDIICDKFSIELSFICFPKNLIKNLENLFYKNTISINRILCSSYCRSLNIVQQNNNNSKICIIDVGYEKTSIYQFCNKNLFHIKTLKIGNNFITKDIAKVCNLSIEESEIIKKNFDIQKNLNKKQMIPKSFFKNSNFKNISSELLFNIISSRVEEIINLAFNSILKNDNFYNKDLKIYFIGNGSKILLDSPDYMNTYLSGVESIEFINETSLEICESGFKVQNGLYKSEAIIVPKIREKTGLFEKLFHFFE